MKKILFLFFTTTLSICLNAQKIIVKDSETNLSLKDVIITNDSLNLITVTDDNGWADLSKFYGVEKIKIYLPGYKPEIKKYSELQKDSMEIKLVLTGIPLQEVVISANRFEESYDNIVQKIQTVRGSELQNINQTSMADVIASTGNIMVQKSQLGGGSPIIRGFEANKVLIVVDGIRMNNAIYRGGHLQNVITLDNATMNKVELVYGPGSVIYGSDALGGVMHFYTKNPVLSTNDKTLVKANVFSRYFSAANGYAGHFDVSVGGKKLGLLTSFTYSKFGDLRQGAVRNPFYGDFGARYWYVKRINNKDSVIPNSDINLQVGSGYTQYDFLQKFIFQPSSKQTHLINIQYSTSSDIPRYDRLTQVSGNNPRYAEWYYGPQKRLLASYHLSLNNTSALYNKAQVIVGYQNIEESRHTRRFNNTSLNHQIEQLDILTLNVDFDKKINKHNVRYGIDGWWNYVRSKAYSEDIVTGSISPNDTRYPDGGSVMFSVAGYITHVWKINKALTLNEGIRLTNVQLSSKFIDTTFFPFPFNSVYQNNTALNGSIGALFKPFSDWKFSMNVSTGFRAPNVDDLGKVFESTPGNLIVPNPDIKPEYVYTGEIGIAKTFDKRITLSTTGYYTYYDNILSTQPSQLNGKDSVWYDGQMSRVIAIKNVNRAYIYGIEGSITGNITDVLSVVGTINYTYGRIKTDTTDYPLDHIPPIFGKISMNLTKNKFRGECFVQYSGWKHLKDYNMIGEDNFKNATAYGMPAWWTLNARITYSFFKSFSMQVACENILDYNYRVFASNISAPGRNFIITIRYMFE